jgi:hypothetical protein
MIGMEIPEHIVGIVKSQRREFAETVLTGIAKQLGVEEGEGGSVRNGFKLTELQKGFN